MASRDFLGVFGGGGGGGGGRKGTPLEEGRSTEGGESGEIELGLGLSLGGRFGTDRSLDAKRPRLARSTSIASACSVSLGDGDGDGDPSPASPMQLLRTSSLPTDTEEERWRRREMQSRRRLETRQKMLGRRSSVGSWSLPGKPAKEDGGDIVNGLQLRRSTGSQGSTSTNKQGQAAGLGDGAGGGISGRGASLAAALRGLAGASPGRWGGGAAAGVPRPDLLPGELERPSSSAGCMGQQA